jgi:NitT/TauT family transport system permease protein
VLIQSRNFSLDVAGEFAVLVILAFVGLALNAILVSVRRRVLFWDPSQKASASTTVKGSL